VAGALTVAIALLFCGSARAASDESRLERMLATIERFGAASGTERAVALAELEKYLEECTLAVAGATDAAARHDPALALATGALAICDELADERALLHLDGAAQALETLSAPPAEECCAVALQRARRLAGGGRLGDAIAALRAETPRAPIAPFHGAIVFAELVR
jgi:hypothetical protein